MRRISSGFVVFLLLSITISSAQDIVGSWTGSLEVQSQEIPIVFNLSLKDGVYTTTMDSPSQGVNNIPTDKTTFEENELIIDMSKMGIVYTGKFDGTDIKGVFKQSGMELPLDLIRGKYEPKLKLQEPKKPYPYVSEEVFFENSKADNIKLAGTLTLPKDVKKPPVVILITGSGPQNRNEELMGHKPFLVLSDHLSRNGIAVLRFDDRGFAQSEGNHENATTFDFVSDAEAAVTYLKARKDDVDIKKIGLIGHSEGGLVAPIVASTNKEIAYCVLLAGPGVSGKDILMAQTRKAMELGGVSEEDIQINEDFSLKIYEICENYKGEESKNKIKSVFNEMKKTSSEMLKNQLTNDVVEQQIELITSPWMLTFIKIEPQDYLRKVNCPVLAINGEKDFQVLAKANLEGIAIGLSEAQNKDVTTQELKGLNHLFQTSETGSFSEYGTNEETFSPIALNIISDWINKRFR